MKVARYVGDGQIAIVNEPVPACPTGGLLIQAEASGLCSGELMEWYMDQKVPHVLGHEVCGRVMESQDPRFPVGVRVFPHHHAPCMECGLCRSGNHVHCPQWKRTKLIPGGLAEFFGVSSENLTDTLIIPEYRRTLVNSDNSDPSEIPIRAVDAALIEPLACVVKCLCRMPYPSVSKGGSPPRVAVVGLGVMGLMHGLLHKGAVCFETNPQRRQWAAALGLDARHSDEGGVFDFMIVCPGTKNAIDFAIDHIAPGGAIMLFSPIGPPGNLDIPFDKLYFKDVSLIPSYSCGPDHTRSALRFIEEGTVRAEQVVSHFIGIDELPEAYQAMKRGELLKPMVQFD